MIEGRDTLPEVSKTWPASEFTAEAASRAHGHVEFLAGLGVHMTGSVENEEKAVAYLLKSLSEIRQNARENIKVEYGIQRPTGAFNIKFLDGMTLAYQNVSNIVCRISDASSATSTDEALLLNAHFDTMIGSTGAADDGSQVGILLEIARLLASGVVPLPRAVVILLNGAEESICQAAHGFIAAEAPILLLPEHSRPSSPPDWRPSLRAALVLEAMGSGGREMFVRSTPNAAWLSRVYAESVHVPRANVIADEIFRSGVFPGETDLFVFRDHGGLPGIDLLFVEDGYSYHSLQDSAERVAEGDLQRCGGHTLALVNGLLHAPELTRASGGGAAEGGKGEGEGEPVFFDILGLYLVRYSHVHGKILHYGTAALGILYWLQSPRCISKLCGTLIVLLGCVLGAALLGGVSSHLNALSWYSDSRVALAMFIPGALCGGLVAKRATASDENGSFQATVGFMSLLLLLLTALDLRSGYMFVVAILPALGCDVLGKVLGARGFGRGLLVIVGCVPAVVYFSQVGRTVLVIFMPVMGRSGMFLPADAFIASLIGIFVFLISSLPASLLSHPPSCQTFALRSGSLSLLALLFSLSRNPYSLARPKRLFVQHTNRVYHDASGAVTGTDAGLWINGFDARGNEDLRAFGVAEWAGAKKMECFWLHCHNPFYLPLPLEFSGGWILDAAPAPFPDHPAMQVSIRHQEPAPPPANKGLRRVWVTVHGPSHMALVFKDEERRVEHWSLAHEVGADQARRGSEGVVFTFFSAASSGPDITWDFWLDIQGPAPINASVHSHYLDFAKTSDDKGCAVTPEMAELQARVPDWVCPTCWRSALHALVL